MLLVLLLNKEQQSLLYQFDHKITIFISYMQIKVHFLVRDSKNYSFCRRFACYHALAGLLFVAG